MTLVDWGSLFPQGHLATDLVEVFPGVFETSRNFSALPMASGEVTFRMELESLSSE